MLKELKKVREALAFYADWRSYYGSDVDEDGGKLARKTLNLLDTLIPTQGWQQIETAPKDGRRVLVVSSGGTVEIAWFGADWHGGDDAPEEWFYGTGDSFSMGSYFNPISPTHWMPLPPPPQSASEAQQREER